MGGCQSSNTAGEFDENDGSRIEGQTKEQPNSSNPFYDADQLNHKQQQVLAKYKFHSKYNDNFIGKCCQLQEMSTGDIYLSKQFVYSDEKKMNTDLEKFKERKDKLTSENVIQIKDLISTEVDGFFGDKHKIILIMDYPFVNFSKEISNRLSKKINFSQEEIYSFVSSTVKGYTNIEQAGFKTDKVRLKNIFFGIKNRQSIIKVAQSSLIAPKSNYEYFYEGGPNKSGNKQIYLAPEQLQAWKEKKKDFESPNKSGVFSLGMCILDLATMDPSRQCYFFTQKDMDRRQILNRIEIAGKKYGGGLQRILRDMLEFDVIKRSSFEQISTQLPFLTKNQQSRMNLSLIPNQRTSIIHNDTSNLKSSKMFKSVVSQKNLSGSRVFSSRIKSENKDEELDNVMENYTNGNKYVGQKKGDIKHGKGKYTFRDGSYYQGDWNQNKISGVGNLYFTDGNLEYSGEWRNDEFNGWGTHFSERAKGETWDKYEGEFKNGVKEGRGKMYFKDGMVYDGEFKGGKICGRGRKINQTGAITEKYWDAMSPDYFSRQEMM